MSIAATFHTPIYLIFGKKCSLSGFNLEFCRMQNCWKKESWKCKESADNLLLAIY